MPFRDGVYLYKVTVNPCFSSSKCIYPRKGRKRYNMAKKANNNNATVNNAQATVNAAQEEKKMEKTFVEMMQEVAQEISREHADDINKVKEEAKKASATVAGAFAEVAEKLKDATQNTLIVNTTMDAWKLIDGNGIDGIHDAAEKIREDVQQWCEDHKALLKMDPERYEQVKEGLNLLEKVEVQSAMLVRKLAGTLKRMFGVNVKIDIEGTLLGEIVAFLGKIKDGLLAVGRIVLETIKKVLCHVAAGTVGIVGFVVKELKALFDIVSSFIKEHAHKEVEA